MVGDPAGLRLVCVDSISLVVDGEDDGQIVFSGSTADLWPRSHIWRLA